MKNIKDLSIEDHHKVQLIIDVMCDCELDRNIARNCPEGFISGLIQAMKSNNRDVTKLEQLLERISGK